jgi:DNA-binding CsgD family transcriptional regulator
MRILRRGPDELTGRQREVLALLRRGLTNEEIGRELGISTDGAKFHVSQILSKLQLSSRHEAASLPPEVGARRPWWAGALAPLPLLREVKWSTAASVAGAAVTAAGVVALVVLAWGVFAVRGEAGGPYLVYAHGVGNAEEAEFSYPTIEVVTYDIERHERVAAFELGGAGDYPAQIVAAGDRVVVNLGNGIVSYARDGSDERVVMTRVEQFGVLWTSVSHDGSMVAYTQRGGSWGSEVVIVSLRTGAELLRLSQDSDAFDGLVGYLTQVTWRDDNRAILIRASTGSDRPGGLATVSLSGDVSVHEPEYRLVAPSGRHIATGDMEWCGLGQPMQHELLVRDSITGDVANSVEAHDRNVGWVEWSADGRELLYREYSFTGEEHEGCPAEDESSVTWHVLEIDTGRSIPVDGPAAARARWYGDAVLTYFCGGEPVDEPWCSSGGGEQPLEVRVGSAVLEKAVLGFRVIHQPQVIHGTSSRSLATNANTHHDAELGMTFAYPAEWVRDPAPHPYASCATCRLFGPREATYPYGVQVFHYDGLSEEELACPISCSVGNRAVAPGGVLTLSQTGAVERHIEVAGMDAEQLDIGRQVPLGMLNESWHDTPYDETWTHVRHEGRKIFIVSYSRLGDEEGKRATSDALKLMLSTLRFD